MGEKVVVRFAPSPTGYLHVGGARTAIYNWLYARGRDGKFVLRIEDTDADRSSEESIQGILDGMMWLGLDWDEGPYFQSHFAEDHLAAANRLLASGHAYRCFCSKEELDRKREQARERKETYLYDGKCRELPWEASDREEASGRPFTIRLKVPRSGGAVRFRDRVYGDIEKRYQDIEDFIIVRTNGTPLYILSNAVDDIRDGITHVIRGQDGLANTPKQILLYEALGARLPEFVHMSLALDPQKAKISKRKHGESVAIHYYRERGFLPWALVNFLVLLGWATSDSRELFSRQELIEAFSFAGISRSNPVFDLRRKDSKFIADPKALRINAHYLRTMPLEKLGPLVAEQLEKSGISGFSPKTDRWDHFLQTVDLIRGRYQLLTDFSTLGRAFFSEGYEIEPKTLEKALLKHEELKIWLPVVGERAASLDPFEADPLEALIMGVAKESGLKPGVIVNGMRAALTGQAVGPGFMEILLNLGRETVSRRLLNCRGLFE